MCLQRYWTGKDTDKSNIIKYNLLPKAKYDRTKHTQIRKEWEKVKKEKTERKKKEKVRKKKEKEK